MLPTGIAKRLAIISEDAAFHAVERDRLQEPRWNDPVGIDVWAGHDDPAAGQILPGRDSVHR